MCNFVYIEFVYDILNFDKILNFDTVCGNKEDFPLVFFDMLNFDLFAQFVNG